MGGGASKSGEMPNISKGEELQLEIEEPKNKIPAPSPKDGNKAPVDDTTVVSSSNTEEGEILNSPSSSSINNNNDSPYREKRDVLSRMRNRAKESYDFGDKDEALRLLRQCLDGYIALDGTDRTVSIADIYNRIGNIHGDYTKDSDQQLKCIEVNVKAAEIRIEVLGEIHLSVAGTYNNIAIAHRVLNQFDSAIEYYQKALKIYEDTCGSSHAYTVRASANLEKCMSAKNRQNNGEPAPSPLSPLPLPISVSEEHFDLS